MQLPLVFIAHSWPLLGVHERIQYPYFALVFLPTRQAHIQPFPTLLRRVEFQFEKGVFVFN